ncbi:hypothetical protein GIB67_008124 [Kingdonia uniflora]|uniref:CP-type G domain-containing protein n=1 Tax=Kingdonia uniflora TaxID=39325 RepID=A0A7J7MSV8_9MAGN|nr:hypothetical protein GIB67_008124 [Kingdonia uniflora]
MPNKSTKSKSKRVTLKQKYKIIKKVKEHHKKKAKEAKKLGVNQRKKVEKNPGIPNDWPLKEDELKVLEARRARAIQELETKKADQKERLWFSSEGDFPDLQVQKRKLGLLDNEDTTSITPAKGKKLKERSSEEDSSNIFKSRDNSDRAFYKELVKVIEVSDVILEVLDARDPLGSRCVDMEKMVMKSGPDKHLVLLLNKIDLVPREAVEKWLKYLREELPAVAFKCSTQEQRSNLGWKSPSKSKKPSALLQTSDCLGAETLIKLLKNYSRSYEIKKSITVGVIGLPNVGKSSLINSLKRSHVVNVGATPGLTRSMQEVHLDKNVKLLDCPGVVMLKSGESNASIALRNCKRIEKLDDVVGPVKEILEKCPLEMLVSLYKTPTFDSVDDFLQKVATVRGKLKKGGIVDVEAAARIVLHDWNEGKIPYYTMPPTRNPGKTFEAAIVSELGKEFNVDEVYTGESSFIGSLVSVEDVNHVELPPSCPLNFDEKMIEDDLQPNALNQVDEKSAEKAEDIATESMGCDVSEASTIIKTLPRSQNEKLYEAEGILNPRKLKADKKRRKKANKSSSIDVMDSDFDFKVDYTNKESEMDVGADKANNNADVGVGNGNDADHQINTQVPMSGVELDN